MTSAAEVRRQIESALSGRIPAALSLRPPVAPELLSCGLAEVDAVLGGGLPLGAITELTGAQSSGRTTFVLSALAEVTRQGESCAYVDVSDALNPMSAAALGVDLQRLLWVRTGEPRTEEFGAGGAGAYAVGSPLLLPALAPAGKHFGGRGGRHPRSEAVGLHTAVGELFHTELFQTTQRERVDFTPRCSEAVRRERVQPVVFSPVAIHAQPIDTRRNGALPRPARRGEEKTAWTRLDRALRATDLLLSTGGFRALVLDMGDVPAEQARRVPLTTWYRFRLQAEKSRTLLLLMTRVACANSCAGLSLHCRQGAIGWEQAEEHSPRLLAGLRYRVSVERNRAVDPTRKKMAASPEADWNSTTPWSR